MILSKTNPSILRLLAAHLNQDVCYRSYLLANKETNGAAWQVAALLGHPRA